MRLGRLGEKRALKALMSVCRTEAPGLRIGIGDDAAAIVPDRSGTELLVSADMLVEGVHYDLAYMTWAELGYRSLACNVSDIAAMGGEPLYYMVSFALGTDTTEAELLALYAGMGEMAREYDMALIGGDSTAAPAGGPDVISVTIIGAAGFEGPVTRSGARPGEDIYVSGRLGDPAAGLRILREAGGAGSTRGGMSDNAATSGHRRIRLETAKWLTARHLRPRPRVRLGRILSEACAVTAMMDISDGLGIDLHRLMDSSGVGAEIYEDKLPLSGELIEYAGGRDSALGYALGGGDDYELLFTSPRGRRGSVREAAREAGVSVTRIGVTTTGRGAWTIGPDGMKPLGPLGYEHFG
jgi:thiamine-monophosphate kinase